MEASCAFNCGCVCKSILFELIRAILIKFDVQMHDHENAVCGKFSMIWRNGNAVLSIYSHCCMMFACQKAAFSTFAHIASYSSAWLEFKQVSVSLVWYWNLGVQSLSMLEKLWLLRDDIGQKLVATLLDIGRIDASRNLMVTQSFDWWCNVYDHVTGMWNLFDITSPASCSW